MIFSRTHILSLICVILFITCLVSRGAKYTIEYLDTYNNNLLVDISYYKLSDSLKTDSIEILTHTVSDNEKRFGDLNKIINDLNSENRRLEVDLKNAMEASFNVTVEWKDSVVYLPGSVDTVILRSINYVDDYLTFRAIDRGQFLDSYIATIDTLKTKIYPIPKKFLFIKHGIKEVRQEVQSTNPYSTLIYEENIKLEKIK